MFTDRDLASARTRATAFSRTDLTRLLRRHSISIGLALAVAGGAGFGIHRAIPAKPAQATPAPVIVAPQLPASLFDFQPSDLRAYQIERLEAGQLPPASGVAELAAEQRQTQLQLTLTQDLTSKYFQEIQNRDAAITQLNQAVASDRSNLAAVAQQLGLPKDQLAPAPQGAQGGVGGFAPIDQGALSSAPARATATNGVVSSAQDLQARVNAYLKLPCPLPAGDARCTQAEDHAKQELARGHGLNLDKPDARPTMDMDVAQTFGPTDVDLEPLQMVDGQMVHFHDGVDLDEDEGQPVMAAANGVVSFAGVIPSGAETVEVTHAGGWKTIYMHESQLLVNVGDHVQKGQVVGLVGMTGLATGPHVHFQVVDPSGTPIDPMPFIQ